MTPAEILARTARQVANTYKRPTVSERLAFWTVGESDEDVNRAEDAGHDLTGLDLWKGTEK